MSGVCETRKPLSKFMGGPILELFAAGLLAFLMSPLALSGEEMGEVLTNAADVLALPAEKAERGIRVRVKGVVTAAEKYWEGRFFVHDASGGVFVDNVSALQPEPGDVVEVSGISHSGAFAPVILQPTWRKVGEGDLPEAKRVTIERLMSGIEDGQRVEITGIVRSVGIEHSLLSVDMVSGGCRLRVYAKRVPGMFLEQLIGAEIRVRGTAAASFNAKLRQLITMKVFAPLPGDFIVEKSEVTDPFNEPTLPLNSIAQYRKEHSPGKRVHVRGIVTHQRLGEDLFLQDETGGLRLKSRELKKFAVGDVIEAAGFPDFENFLPILADAVFRQQGKGPSKVEAREVTIEELQAGFHHAAFVSIRGRLLDRVTRRLLDESSKDMQLRTVLMFQSGASVFSAETATKDAPVELTSVPVGSIVEVSGIALAESNQEGRIKSLQILLPNPQSFRVLQQPSWLTPRRLLVGLAVLFGISIVAVSWTVIISKKNAALGDVIREKEKGQIELQRAHDHLEEKVKERTEQLRFQISARKEIELHSQAVLSERTRLAQELHDTLEQTLTGIGLQLDTTAKLFSRKPDNAQHHLELARNLVGQSQVEVRRSIWDLRSRASQQFDLAGALVDSGRRITDGTRIQLEVAAHGRVRPLSETIEENLLRIAQEALTNVIKHSGATLAKMKLDYGPQNVVLEVRDNGKGFTPENCLGPNDGHFGLLGMSERARRLGGRIDLSSRLDEGTTLRVHIPLVPAEFSTSPVSESEL